MRVEEAVYIKSALDKYARFDESILLNLGSSTENFRKVEQPHIDRELFSQLNLDHFKVIHFDLKEDIGVDISGDIFDLEIQKRLESIKPQFIMCCNFLEHLDTDLRKKIPFILDKLLDVDGVLLITVPYSYPLHLDPIDTYFRPSPSELSNLFLKYKVLDESVIKSNSFFYEYMSYTAFMKIRFVIRLFTPFYKYKEWKSLVHRVFWLFRPYEISCVSLRKIKKQ